VGPARPPAAIDPTTSPGSGSKTMLLLLLPTRLIHASTKPRQREIVCPLISARAYRPEIGRSVLLGGFSTVCSEASTQQNKPGPAAMVFVLLVSLPLHPKTNLSEKRNHTKKPAIDNLVGGGGGGSINITMPKQC